MLTRAALREVLVSVLKENFPDEVISYLKIESVDFDQDEGEIRIVLLVGTEVAPEKFAEGYFGLTNSVQERFKDDVALSNYFPIIRPDFGHGVHAA